MATYGLSPDAYKTGKSDRSALVVQSPSQAGAPQSEDAAPQTNMPVISRDGTFFPGWGRNTIVGNPDKILAKEGQNLELFDALLDDDVAMEALQQRRLAILSKDWEVAPGDPEDARSVKAADDLRAMLKAVGWDRVTSHMHYAVWYGYGVAENLYTTKLHDGRTIIWLNDIVVPDRRWFGFTSEGELKQNDGWAGFSGETLPDNTFWTVRSGGSHDFAFYGMGLAHWAYWPVFFKRAGLQFWALFLEKFGQPTVGIAFQDGASDTEKAALLNAAIAIGKDSAVLVPAAGLQEENIKIFEASRSGSGASSYQQFITEQNEALMRVVLGQPGTSKATPGGIGTGQADSHDEVKEEIVKADADLISEAFNRGPAVWLTRWNHGPDVAPPTVFRVLDDVEDLDSIADRDVKLDGIGIKRTEDSIKEVYGEAYERVETPPPPTALEIAQAKAGLVAPVNDNAQQPNGRAAQFDAHDPAPLYVRRDLEKTAEFKAWAKDQGFGQLVPDLHVTILYSKTPVDWFAMGDAWGMSDGRLVVPAGGPRKVGKLGDEGAVVLHFASPELRYRHDAMIERGASSDYPDYQAHITITYDGGDVDLEAVEPFVGELHFGPEIFEAIKGFDPTMIGFNAADDEAIERLTTALTEDSNPVFRAIGATIRDSLEGVDTIEGVRVAMLQAWERLPVEQLARLTALPMLAERAGAAAGATDDVTA